MPQTRWPAISAGGLPAQFRVWSDRVVIVPPGGQNEPGMGQRGEQRLAEAFVPQTTIEALDEAVLHWPARRDVVPMALRQYCHEWPQAREQARRFLLTVGGIGLLYKQRASISSAEMSCQGEVGVACSMEAAGLAAVWGGPPDEGQLSTHLRPSAGLVRGSRTCLAASTESLLKGDILKPTPLRT